MQSRRRTGCWVCWKRKLKCDSSAPVHCTNCAKRGVECRYDEPPGASHVDYGRVVPSRDVTEAGLQRDRARRACVNCASQKLKCSGDEEGCGRCLRNDLVCKYTDSKRTSGGRSILQIEARSKRKRVRGREATASRLQISESPDDAERHGSSSPQASMQKPSGWHPAGSAAIQDARRTLPGGIPPPKDIIRRHIEAYFEYIYPITTYGFLHQGSILESLDKNTVPPILLKSISICASPYVDCKAATNKLIAAWKDEVDLYIMRNMRSFTILNLQVILLWANYQHYMGDWGRTWMLISLAARMAYCLQIQVESTVSSRSVTEVECCRRMMWNIHIMDRLLAGTVDEFSLTRNFVTELSLPCDDHFYLAEIAVETDTVNGFARDEQIPNIGAFAALAGLMDIWRDILIMMRSLREERSAERIISQTSVLHKRLSDFETRLPLNLRFIDRNLYIQPTTSQRITFMMLQSWWRECNYDLFRFILPGFRESVDTTLLDGAFVSHCRRQVVRSAVMQSTTWQLVKSNGLANMSISDPLIVPLVHSNIKVLLACKSLPNIETLLNDIQLDAPVRDFQSLLVSNVAMLDDLAQRIPRVATIQRELQKMIHQTGLKTSAEDSLNQGLPLKRRHSRESLNEASESEETSQSGQDAQSPCGTVLAPYKASENDIVTVLPGSPHHLAGPGQGESMAGPHSQELGAIGSYLYTPVSLTGCSSSTSQNSPGQRLYPAYEDQGLSGQNYVEQGGILPDLRLQQEPQQQKLDLPQAAPFPGLAETDYFGGWLSYFTTGVHEGQGQDMAPVIDLDTQWALNDHDTFSME